MRLTGTRPTNGHNGPPQTELDRFVCACVVVQQMCVLYDRCELGRPGPMEVSRDDFPPLYSEAPLREGSIILEQFKTMASKK
jgi:hypothetical protein